MHPDAALEAVRTAGTEVTRDDVEPSITVFEGDDVEVSIGGLIQVHLAPWVGDDSLLTNDDAATREGFRLRRARLGVAGTFGGDVRLLVVVNPLESDPDVGTVSDASISLEITPGVRLGVGTTKVPLSRAGLESSSSLATIERPLTARTLVPDRRLGATLEGSVLDHRLGFLAAFMNATEGYDEGNRFGGFLYAGRVQYALWGRPDRDRPEIDGAVVGLGGVFENGPATRTMAASADVMVAAARSSVKVEVLCDRTTPQDSPIISPGVADSVDRCGGYVEAGYTLPRWSLQPVVRAELFDDDRAVEDAGDVMLVSAGANASLRRHSRVQLHYQHRRERYSNARNNDALILSVQGGF